MPDSQDILRLRVLLCFLKDNSKDNTVTGISRILNEEKYKVSRILIALEKEGMLNRSDARHPVLTENGRKEAVRYSERLEITLNHLLYEGVDSENAMSDAFYWTLYSSDKTIETVRAAEERCIEYEFVMAGELRDYRRKWQTISDIRRKAGNNKRRKYCDCAD